MILLHRATLKDSKTPRFAFSDFSMNFYGISKFATKITNKSLKTLHLSHGLRRQPPGFLFLSTQGPWPWSEEGRGFDQPNLATVIAGGEGGGAWEVHQALAHL